MKKTRKSNSNSGFTLVELIIAMAILAFLMTAVCSLMSTGVFSFRKAKADITVTNTAQNTYNQLTDAIMEANNIVIYGYVNTGTASIDFSVPGSSDIPDGVNLSDSPAYYVRDAAQAEAFKETVEYKAGAPIYYFSNLTPDTEIYVVEFITESAEDIDISLCKPSATEADKYYNYFSTDPVVQNRYDTIERKMINVSDDPDMPVYTDSFDANHNWVYDKKDTVRTIYTFDENEMFLEKKYAYMYLKNDYCNDADPDQSMADHLYSSSISYVSPSATVNVTGCIMKVDAAAGAIEIDIKYNDKNMTFESKGFIETRNSYVIVPKGAAPVIEVTPEADPEED